MNAYTFPLFAVLAVFFGCAGAAALWHQQRYIRHLRALLDHNEQARRALAEQLLELSQHIEAAPAGPAAGQRDADREDVADRRRELERVLAASIAGDSRWLETQPTSVPPVEFEPTRPLELNR